MKKWSLLLILIFAASVGAQEIPLPDGRTLHRAHIAKVFAGEFTIEHDGGIAHVAWRDMPELYQKKFPLDPDAVALEQAAVSKQNAAEKERLRIERLPRVLIYGKVSQVNGDFASVRCEPAAWSVNDWNRNAHIPGDSSRSIHISRDLEPLAKDWQEGQQVIFVGREDATISYVSLLQKHITLAHISNLEELPRNIQVSPLKRDAAAPSAPPPPAVTVVPAQSKSPNEMELPRYNLDTTLEDLKPGITAEKARRILGSPLYVNGRQWVYRNGYVYVEDGIVVALQNRAGEVFAKSWK
jgi:hypothetical protein